MKIKYLNLIIGGTLILLGSIPVLAAATAASTKFLVGDRIYVKTGTANVRQTPAGTLIGTQATDALGTVTQGPVDALFGGVLVHWWAIDYDSGRDGWVGEDKLATVTPTPTVISTSGPVQQTYTVVAGDTLSAIGKKLGIVWQDIAVWNNMVYPYYLSIGQVLKVSGPAITPTPTPTPTSTPTPTPTAVPTSAPTSALFRDTFAQYSDGLITNEYAYWNPSSSSAKKSAVWEMTSGSLFAQGGAGWTGVPNAGAPNALSTNANNSSIFRLTTKQSNFGNVAVDFDLLNQGLSSNSVTPAVSWDGVHVFLRYQSEESLYYVSVNRRDNTLIVKKKVPGGPSNGGTYYNIGFNKPYSVPYGSWQHIKATIKNNSNGSVTIQLFANGTLILNTTDSGTGGAPITGPGKVGIRGDNANLKFKNFTVTGI